MTKTVLEKLELWASNNNWSLSHPLDSERFWDFVIEAFRNGDLAIPEDDFYGTIVKHCSDEDALTESYIRYENGIALLKQYAK